MTNTNSTTFMSQSLLSLVLIVVAFVFFDLMVWNEIQVAKTARSLSEATTNVQNVLSLKIDPANEGKLVHVFGQVTSDEILEDPDFSVAVKAVRLYRRVEMYQWHRRKTGENPFYDPDRDDPDDEYYYEHYKDWAEELNKLYLTGHYVNPKKPLPSKKWSSSQATIDAFTLDQRLIDKIDDIKLFRYKGIEAKNNSHKEDQYFIENYRKMGDVYKWYYLTDTPNKPALGDVRIQYRVLPDKKTISVIAQQVNNSLKPFKTDTGEELSMVSIGEVAANRMLRLAREENSSGQWLKRILGFFFLGATIYLLLDLKGKRPLIPLSIGLTFSLTTVTVILGWLIAQYF